MKINQGAIFIEYDEICVNAVFRALSSGIFLVCGVMV